MKGGRKNLKRASKEDALNLEEGQSIMQVVSLRGSNIIEVMDAGSKKSLALFPTKFQKSMWIKRGSFVVVDGSGRDKVLESGNKVASIVSQVLFHKRVRVLQVSPEWRGGYTRTLWDDAANRRRWLQVMIEDWDEWRHKAQRFSGRCEPRAGG
ncbi:hypothetical protein GIB67_041089 [Kingdonia uniflora]|uniref:S1-like domain-containing protein n=1 Tax=Kingdonia uniflora TaxID=39325 RepID=A0A7J7LK24_9MAGN|nr:hypothetical protein GIB67_041089 [Kingdonia uniflora]